MNWVIDALPNLTLGGLSIAVGVYLLVEALKLAKLVKDGDPARLANLICALVLSGVWASTQFWPSITPVVNTLYVALIGGLVAGLGYEIIGKVKEGVGKLFDMLKPKS